MKAGDRYATNNYGELEIVEYINCYRVLVRFTESGFELFAQAGGIRRGTVKDPLYPFVYGVGFLGVGDHKSTICGVNTVCYKVWTGMLKRCYCPKHQASWPTYAGCSVTSEWHDFQVFAEWFEVNYIDGFQLDKDLIVEGNKVYSPEACSFVGGKTNSFTLDKGRARGDHLIGAHWDKNASAFMSQCRNPFVGRQEYLGLFKTELEAHNAWKARKHALALLLADEQQDQRVAAALRVRYLPSNRTTGAQQ